MTQEFFDPGQVLPEPKSAIIAPPPIEKYGEQNRNDATAGIEREADRIAQASQRMLEEMMPSVINRAPDSHPVSDDDQFSERQAKILDQEAIDARLEGESGMQSIGPERAKLNLVRWDAKHQERMKRSG